MVEQNRLLSDYALLSMYVFSPSQLRVGVLPTRKTTGHYTDLENSAYLVVNDFNKFLFVDMS